ncbi:unnamed protein product [[Candida] boidinii]|uniref:Unnamed protein product n=1 Tax=Candida boidinii TaxID=5477 RepID=A0A9W6WF83_CANBO|nr:unnamed protein product [[Candida] boidinii]
MAIIKRGNRNRATGGGPPAKSSGIQKAQFEHSKKKEVGVSDLTLLSTISDQAINENLEKRFHNGTIYTYIGHVLISVNPFRDLGIYTDQVLKSYKNKNRLEVPPHVFAIAEAMFYNLRSYNENQCVIISGESGAGKTEAAKRIMQYIASSSADSYSSAHIQRIKDMVLATNPLLESFGCAKTLRNNNSSRHGKYLEIFFNKSHEPVSANITNYLLEKQRVVGQIKNERNFHIFYQFTKGASDNYRQTFGVQMPEYYTYTSGAGCTSVDGIDDLKDFKETIEAMRTIGLTQDEQDQVFRLLSAILYIGNIRFAEDEEGNSKVQDTSITDFVAYLLSVNPQVLCKSITERIVETNHGMKRGSIYHVPLNPVQANAVKNALAKGIYNNLFDWIVDRVNKSFHSTNVQVEKSIGILDIYGFEIFDHNSFEQLCINYVNEKLQQIFITLTLKSEQDEYVKEQIQWTPIKYFNNKVVCDLIEAKRPPGIFAALNDACATAHADSTAADQSFSQRLNMVASNAHFELRSNKFIVKHYAGDVTYDVNTMTDKNKDQMLKDLLEAIKTSENPFLNGLFPDAIDESSKRRPPTAGDKIKTSANLLVDTLSKAQPSYIRTIKPNENKSPTEYNNKNVLHQVKYLGLQENVRIRRAGFAYRQTYEKFAERFYLLSSKTSYAGEYTWHGDAKEATKIILQDADIPSSEWQTGVTKIFIKKPETLFALEDLRENYWADKAKVIQRAVRKYLVRRENAAKIVQRLWRQVIGTSGGNEYEKLRDFGNTLVVNRKERRRLSLLGSRQFLGDYLNCNDKVSGPGKYLVKSLSISEKIVFSGNGQLLFHKFGKSSKRLNKTFLLTNTKFYVIGRQIVNKKTTTVIEQTIPIQNIKSVGLSSFQDDWVAINLDSKTLPDLLINLMFKTELITHLKQKNRSLIINIGETIKYNKKPGKAFVVKFQLSSNTLPGSVDTYKSGLVSVEHGLPASSQPREKPKGKSSGGLKALEAYKRSTQARTNTNILGASVSNGVRNSDASAAAAAAFNHQRTTQHSAPVNRKPPPSRTQYQQPQPQQQQQQHQPQRVQRKPAPVAPKPSRKKPPVASPTHHHQEQQQQQQQQSYTQQQPVVTPRAQAAAPPPPPPQPVQAIAEPPKPKHPTYIANYDFPGTGTPGAFPVKKDEIFYITQEAGNGWSMASSFDESKTGWVPTGYISPCDPPSSLFGGNGGTSVESASLMSNNLSASTSAQTTIGNTNGYSNGNVNVNSGGDDSGLANDLATALMNKKKEESVLAGSLAEAIRQKARRESDDEADSDDDDW